MQLKSAAESRPRIPSSFLESQLQQAPHKPEALYQVVSWVWSSLVYAATHDGVTDEGLSSPTTITAATITATTAGGPTASAAAKGRTPVTDPDGAKFSSATPLASTAGAVQWEAQALSLQPSFSASAAASPLQALAAAGSNSGAASGLHDPATPYLEHTMAGRATSSGAVNDSDGDEFGGINISNHNNNNISHNSYLHNFLTGSGNNGSGDGGAGNYSVGTTHFDATLTAATATAQSFITTITASTATAPSSVAEWPLCAVPNAQHEAPLAQLSPLVLRLLLWWGTRPQLPSMHGGNTSSGVGAGLRDAWPAAKDATNGSSDSGDGDFVLAQQRRQLAAEEAHQLRLRIAQIFHLLCRRGYGVVVSDVLLYGRCHDASEAAAARCNLVFGGCSDAAWRAATTTTIPCAPTTAKSVKQRADSTDSGVTELQLDSPHPSTVKVNSGCGVGSSRYSLGRLLRALVELHTLARQPGGVMSQSRPGGSSVAAVAAVDADVTAAGLLLRSLLQCPRLHKRVVRLFDRDRRPAKVAKPVFHSAHSTTLLSCTPSNAPQQGGSRPALHPNLHSAEVKEEKEEEEEEEEAANTTRGNLRLQSFLLALTHASPVVSSESWLTLGALLFPSATMTTATRKLLQRTPECPVQHLLASALALPENDTPPTSASPLNVVPPPPPPSHPMARNSALRILHVLCVSKDIPPAAQLLFTQCPALLWRVLKLAAALSQGVPVANMALVRRVLADYVMSAVRPSTAAAVSATLTPTQQLLKRNRDALTTLFASTYALWGMRGGLSAMDAAADNGGDCAEAATDAVYDEEDLQRAVQMLEM